MNFFRYQRTPAQWANSLGLFLDVIAIGAVAMTQDVRFGFFIPVGILLLFRIFRPFRISARGAALLSVMLIFSGIVIWKILHFHPILAAASVAPMLHAFLWVAPTAHSGRIWRISLGFVELILASSLTVSVFLPLAIIAYVVLGSVSLSCHFLDRELATRTPELRNEPLGGDYIPRMMAVSCLIFFIAVLIFPFLPRLNKQSLSGTDRATGYTEEVSISSWGGFANAQEGSSALLIYMDGEDAPELFILRGLIRSRTLDQFDGEKWTPSVRQPAESLQAKQRFYSGGGRIKSQTLHVIREALGTESLPVPYGSRFIDISEGNRQNWNIPTLLQSGDWVLNQSQRQRYAYQVELYDLSDRAFRNLPAHDIPTDLHLHVPDRYQKGPFANLSKTLFSGTKTDLEKIRAVQNHLMRGGYQGSTSGPQSKMGDRLTPLEHFMFIEKQGHCELFSSAVAILLRSAGVPTRLVAGFRISHSAIQGMLIIKSDDAHAWVETWNPERGWIPLDLTPRMMAQGSIWSMLKRYYSFLDASWSRYVLSYGESGTLISWIKEWKSSLTVEAFRPMATEIQEFARTQKDLMGLTLLILGIVGGSILLVIRVWFPWIFSIRYRVNEGGGRLRYERRKMELLLLSGSKLKSGTEWMNPEARRHYEDWKRTYELLRFGKSSPSPLAMNERLNRLRKCRQQLMTTLKLTIVILMLGDQCQASAICDYYKRSNPDLYKIVCANGSASTKPAGANSTFSDSFNISAASLPTEPSSYGLETIGNFIRNDSNARSPTFSLIKGFHKFGTGLSTSGNNTFYGNDMVQRLYGPSSVQTFEVAEEAKGSLINLNLGTSILLLEPKNGPKLTLGTSVRYNKITDTWGGGPALLLSWTHLSLGAGYTRERVSSFLPRSTFTTLLVSTRLSFIELEYSRLLDLTNNGLSPIHIYSASASIRRLTLTAAIRELNYVSEGYVFQTHFAFQYVFSKHFSAGFLFNYIPGANSIGTQIFL